MPRWLTASIAVVGLVASSAAIALPVTAQTSEIAAILALGALAVLAGHRWGVAVLVAADIALLGRVWPLILHDWPPSATVQIATYAALAGALPGLLLLRRAVPHALETVLGRRPSARLRATGLMAAQLASALWLVVPALS